MCQEGWVILIKILYLPMNQQSLHHTMASGLLIDQKTFRKKGGKNSISSVLSAIKDECLWEQLFRRDHVYSHEMKNTMNPLIS